MDIKVIISIKYGWNAIVWQKSSIWDILFKIYWVSKSIPPETSQYFVDSSEAQNPHGQDFWNLNFFFFVWRRKVLDISRKKSSWTHIIFIHKYYNEIVGKIVKQPKTQGKNETLQFLESRISIFLQISSSTFHSS